MYKIAISGKAKSGKNTVASIILEELAFIQNKKTISNKIIAFADPIKEIILKMFPSAKREYLFGPSELRSEIIDDILLDDTGKPLTYRQALINIGDFGRKYNSSIWVKCFEQEFIAAIKEEISVVIVPDLRFFEEFNYLKNNNFLLIKLNRNDITAIDHISETSQEKFKISDFNFIVNNNADMSSLRDNIKRNLIPLLINSNN